PQGSRSFTYIEYAFQILITAPGNVTLISDHRRRVVQFTDSPAYRFRRLLLMTEDMGYSGRSKTLIAPRGLPAVELRVSDANFPVFLCLPTNGGQLQAHLGPHQAD